MKMTWRMDPAATYVVAVSGGVDSVVLLDMLATDTARGRLAVAHFDHGIRDNSEEDEVLVRSLAEKYDLEYRTERAELGQGASEAVARAARYSFLRRVATEVSAAAIITAHHQDDLIETALLNILRGSGRQGLSPLTSQSDIRRPLLEVSKAELLAYAADRQLIWHEDSTNADVNYRRNYIRLELLPKLMAKDPTFRQHWLEHINRQQKLNIQIDDALRKVTADQLTSGDQRISFSRRWFIGLPHAVAKEIVLLALQQLPVKNIDRRLLERLTVFMKTKPPGKQAVIDARYSVIIDGLTIQIGDWH